MKGLVLEGGGARGAYQVGVLKALREMGYEFDGVSGTSVGALNGAMIIQNDYENLYDLWYNLSTSQVLNIDEEMAEKLVNLGIKSKDIKYFIKQIREIFNNSGIDITPLKGILKKYIDEDKIRKSNKDFGIVTISLSDMKPMELYIEDIKKGKLINYLLSSARLPVFKQEKVDGKLFLDGGFYNNLPINMLVSKGYKDLIVVRLRNYQPLFNIKDEDLNISYVIPSENLGSVLDFSQSRIRENMKIGYFDAYKTLQKLKGNKYYVKPLLNEDHFIKYFMNLEESIVLRIGNVLGIEDMPYRRMLFEHIIPKIAELLKLKKNFSYEDLVLALYEEAASRYEIDRFKIVDFAELEVLVLEKFKPRAQNVSSKIPKFLKQSDLVLKTFKDDILSEIIEALLSNIASITSP